MELSIQSFKAALGAAPVLFEITAPSLNKNKANKYSRNEAYAALKNASRKINEQNFLRLLNSDDPYLSLKQMHVVSDDQLQCISKLTPHTILSMIKEIRSA